MLAILTGRQFYDCNSSKLEVDDCDFAERPDADRQIDGFCNHCIASYEFYGSHYS